MQSWTDDELLVFSAADDLHVSPFRDDGVTCGTPTWVWSVVTGKDLYVRAYYGQKSRWYQAAIRQKAGQISIAGVKRPVSFETVAGQVNDAIDEAYRAKYSGSPYLPHMIGGTARAATMRIHPREPE